MLTLPEIREWIVTLGIAEDENVYIGKLDNKKQKSVIVSGPLYAPVLPASPTSTRGLTQPRIFFRYLQDFGNPIV